MTSEANQKLSDITISFVYVVVDIIYDSCLETNAALNEEAIKLIEGKDKIVLKLVAE